MPTTSTSERKIIGCNVNVLLDSAWLFRAVQRAKLHVPGSLPSWSCLLNTIPPTFNLRSMNDSMTPFNLLGILASSNTNTTVAKQKDKAFLKNPVIHPNAFTILSSKDSIISSAFFLAIFPVWGSLDALATEVLVPRMSSSPNWIMRFNHGAKF